MSIHAGEETPRYGIIGWPLGHSLSPTLHNWALRQFDLPGEYTAYPLPPEDMDLFMAHMRETRMAGLSVTIPHKQTIKPFLNQFDDGALAVGAVNTVYWKKDQLIGENTDIFGFCAPLRKMPIRISSALVFGAGGAARAVVAGLLQLGVPDIIITNRNPDKAMELANEFHVSAADWDERHRIQAELLVNTTPLGMLGKFQELSPLPENMPLSSSQIAYDIVYNPLETVFLAQAKAKGCRTVDGLEMFLHQGVEQFRLWTGQMFDISAARTLLLNALQQA
ncbi:shikimate dehydrogenase [Desulfobaculum bizertense]|uniref:Shikimate dehydrogenase (NADP(+)) n=1 Tax=Desulfobaculum bizertense DSM 18034 TaxID=1121442 RepID=A0A1T4WZX7_9BACT|nr:shikimate dehydrogenase [Desulfobaculum bizertense]UIJ37340.1 shikimate dehydrogenase [Desulfobaculum bizertense]SKA82912.1 shikimate dehydrogenase [Desulfobaculum bizertense DSM 18034]